MEPFEGEAPLDLEKVPPLSVASYETVADFLLAEGSVNRVARWGVVEETLRSAFPEDTWGISWATVDYDPNGSAHQNIYDSETVADYRAWLAATGIDASAYALALGPTQYVSIDLHLLKLKERLKKNEGWRVRLIGFPAIDLLVVGLASNHNGSQAESRSAKGSARINAAAMRVLSAVPAGALASYDLPTRDHWSERALMPAPLMRIGNIDLTGYKGPNGESGAALRMVRNTTAKKDIATFFAIRGVFRESFDAQQVGDLRTIALELGEVEA
jgi:hypothetical protein